MELRWSDFVGPRTKVHRIDEGYAWVPKTRDFAEDPRKEIQKIEVVGLRWLPTCSSTLQEVGILPTLVLVPIFLLIFGLKEWKKLRGYLGKKCKISAITRCFLPRSRCSLRRRCSPRQRLALPRRTRGLCSTNIFFA